MNPEQKVLPKKIHTIYDFFEQTKNPKWEANPFKPFKPILKEQLANHNIMLAMNISNLNFYKIDFSIDKRIPPNYIIKYIKDEKLRNLYSDPLLNYTIDSIITREKKWIETETYKDTTNNFVCILSSFEFLQYSECDMNDKDVSESKFYIAYKILNAGDKNVLRFEIVLNSMDIDQEVDLMIYTDMITKMLKAIYNKHRL